MGKDKGAAAELSINGRTYTGVSGITKIEDLHPSLQKILEKVPKKIKLNGKDIVPKSNVWIKP